MLSHFIVSCIVLWRLCTWLVQLKVIFYPPVVYFKIWPLLHRAIFSWMSNVENRASFSTHRVKTETNCNSRFIRILPQFRRFFFIFTRVFLGYLWYFHFFRLAVVISTQLDRSALQWINKKIIMTKSARRGSMVPQEPSNNLFKSDKLIATFPQWIRGI